MPSLREFLDFAATHLDADRAQIESFEREVRIRWGSERVYLPPIDSRKDPARAEHARELAKRLPTGIVAQRTGLSVGYVRRLVRR